MLRRKRYPAAGEKGDYIRVNHMDLKFTGFYTVDTKEEISGYYYIGTIGQESWFVEIPAKMDDAGLSQAMPDLEDMEFVAQVSEDTPCWKRRRTVKV